MHKLILVVSGQLDVEGSAGGWLILPNHLIFIPAERPFTIRSSANATIHVAHLDPADAPWPHHGCWTTVAPPLTREMLAQAVTWLPDQVSRDATPRLFFRTMSGLCAGWFANPRMLWVPSATSEPMRRIFCYLREHLGNVRLDQAAAQTGLSIRTLQRRCQTELGLPWQHLVREVRMMRAMELLSKASMPISAIAREVGFASVAAFTTAFSGRFGFAPTQYMRAVRPDIPAKGSPRFRNKPS